MNAVWWLTRRELIRFLRQPGRIVAAIGTPLLIWLFLGSGFAGSFVRGAVTTDGDVGYAAYLVPGMASMIVLFSAIFAAMSLIEDRHAGFMQAVAVSPASMRAALQAKMGACALLSTAQAAVVLASGGLVGLQPGVGAFLLALVALTLLAMGTTGLCLAAAWHVDSSQGFHGVMNMLLMPMWLLSGAVFPLDGSATWLAWVMRLNPLTWSSEALREAMTGTEMSALAWGGSAGYAVFGFVLVWWVSRRS